MANSDVKRLFISTVGTSLIENNPSLAGAFLDYEHQLNGNNFEKLEETYLDLKIDDKVLDCPDDAAEIKALETYGVTKDDKFILLCTITVESRFCAGRIKQYFGKKDFENINIEFVPELKGANDEDFAEKGLPSFLNTVARHIQEGRSEGRKVVLNPTGGYKALFPLMTITGILYGLEVIYVYEDGKNIVKIPPLPLGLDIENWSRNRIRVETVIGKTIDETKDITKSLSTEMLALIKEVRGRWDKTPMMDFFAKQWATFDTRFSSPLHLASKETSLKGFIKNENLWSKFSRLADLGYLIWKGDSVPEMVDHAARHHRNLFEIAERILLPMLSNATGLLSEEELFILLCTIYLHDCGHVLSAVNGLDGSPIQLLPIEIREFHHVLGYERLRGHNQPGYRSEEIYKALAWENDSREMWNKYLEAIATIGLYHRKCMPLHVEGGTYMDYPFEPYEKAGIGPLCKKNVCIGEKTIGGERLIFISSLFRIIDSLDNQVRRSGDETEIEFHLSQLETERIVEDNRACQFRTILEEILEKSGQKSKCDEIDRIIDAAIGYYRDSEKKKGFWSTNPSEHKKLKPKEMRDQLGEVLCKTEKAYRGLVWEYIAAKMRADFKDYQKIHYRDHSIVKMILVSYDYKNSQHKLIIDLDMDAEMAVKYGKNPSEERKKLLDDMKKEYEGKSGEKIVKGILNSQQIFFQYGDNNS